MLFMKVALQSWTLAPSFANSYSISFQLERLIESLMRRFFYMGYKPLDSAVRQERTNQVLQIQGARKITVLSESGKKIEAIYISSTSAHRTGNALVFALTEPFQKFNPRYYRHLLKDGADIVLWNPTQPTAVDYARDLQKVLKKLKESKPEQRIAVKAYCMPVQSAIWAVSSFQDSSISLILDRGFGKVQELARSITLFANQALCRRKISEKFDVNSHSHIQRCAGNVLFLAPERDSDQLLCYGKGKNFTYDLYESRRAKGRRFGDRWITLPNGDHWSKWDYRTHNKVKDFLCKEGIITSGYCPVGEKLYPLQPPPSFFSRIIIPLLAKSWF